MSQATLDDEELFDEAATEMREDVESSLAAARTALPEADTVWTVDADNTLGVLNGLKGALDMGDAEEHLRDAKKWFAMGREADAFENSDDLETAIAEVEETLSEIRTAHEQVSELTAIVPKLRGALQEFEDDS